MASFLPPAIFEIKAVADQAIAKFKEVEGELDKMGKQADGAGGKISNMDKASKLATGALIGMGTAFAGFAAIGIKGVIEDEKAFTKLGQTFSNLGINIEANRNLVGELDAAYSKLGFGGDETATALNKLVSTTNDLEMSQGLLSISADLARVKNIDLASAAAVVGKASMGNAKAFKEMGITLDDTLPKSEAITKAMGELNDKVGGQAIAYTKTFAGQLVVLREQISGVADTVGGALLPYLKQMVDVVANSIEFIKKNSAVFKTLAGVIITITVALAAYNAAVKVQMALTKAWSVITGVQAAITKLLTGQQVALNTAMKLNPIGLIVSAAVLLIGALVLLWNKSETFRKMMIQVGKVGLMALGFLIKVTGEYAQSVIKLVTGPLKLLLKGLALLGVGGAKEALKGLESATEGVGKFFDSAAKKVTDMAGSLDKLNKPIKLTFAAPPGVPELPNATGATGGKGGAGGKGGVSKETIKANEGYMKIIKDTNDKITNARTKFNETMAELEKDYNKTTTKLREAAASKIANLTKNHNEKVAKLEADAKKKTVEATNKFNETMADLNVKRGEDLLKAQQDNIEKVAELTAQGNEKLQSIVAQSVNRLRDAYKKGTEFSVTDLFKGLSEAGTASIGDLLTKMKDKLAASKELAKNAAALQAKGFSQTFIEEVVAAGPEVGNKLAQSIMDANPETIKELQATYADIEATTDTGLDALAKAMNAGGKLATAELNKAYAEAQTDLQQSLTKQAAAYTAQQAQINKTFNQAMAEAEKTRDTAIAAAMADLAEALAEENKQFNEAVATVNSELATSLAEAQADFVEKSEAARKELNNTLTEIEKDFKDKMGKISDATKATSSEITKMLANFNATKAIMQTPIVIPAPIYAAGASGGFSGGSTGGSSSTQTATTNITTNVTAQTNASPTAIAAVVTNGIKYGTVNTTTLAGIMAASAPKTTSAPTSVLQNSYKGRVGR
jgi:DNA-directed RNA polymerase subunit F